MDKPDDIFLKEDSKRNMKGEKPQESAGFS
ncbi:hypothetical protein EDD76_11664 [Kineothrix alysoides]|uniref:Uncharacterized protein n=1 Tax=Kineothrix alysoides TaxID=1469948 RepID=A0A4R1QW28_9FIRM|nr:hypothetical protein EDD76_11664 [Kineothrix alysoides]